MMLTLLREYRAATPSYFLRIIIQLYIAFVNNIFQFSIAKYSYICYNFFREIFKKRVTF